MEKINFRPTKPKDASTLIIIKNVKEKICVLMGQRSMKSKFMPGIFVFPGGVIEKDDSIAFKFFKLKANKAINQKALKSYSNIHSQSLLLAAIRETAEETGLYLAKKKITLISRLLTVIALGMILQKNLIFLAQINYFSLEGPLLHQN